MRLPRIFVAEPLAVFTLTGSASEVSPLRVMVNFPVTGPASLAFGTSAVIVSVESVVAAKFAPLKFGPTVMLLLNCSLKLRPYSSGVTT